MVCVCVCVGVSLVRLKLYNKGVVGGGLYYLEESGAELVTQKLILGEPRTFRLGSG